MNNKRKSVGKVNEEERDELKLLFERRNGLKELFLIVTEDNPALYEKIVKDMGHTATSFQTWWDEKSKKYGWESEKNSRWEIDFNTCDIYLVYAE